MSDDPRETQGKLFDDVVATPLFSRSPMRVPEPVFQPKRKARTPRLFGRETTEELFKEERLRLRRERENQARFDDDGDEIRPEKTPPPLL